MMNKLKEFFTLKRTMVVIAFAISLLMLLTMGCKSGSVVYDDGIEYILFKLNKITCGFNDVCEYYVKQNQLLFSQGFLVLDYSGSILTILIYIFAFLSCSTMLAYTLISKDTKNKIFNYACGGVLFVCAILTFLSTIFAKNAVAREIIGLTSSTIKKSDFKAFNFSYGWEGFFTLVACGLIVGSAFIKDGVTAKGLASSTFNKCKALLTNKNKKEEKTPAPKVEAEVIASPKVDVAEELQPTSEPEIERVSPAPVEEKVEEIPTDKKDDQVKEENLEPKKKSSSSKKSTKK